MTKKGPTRSGGGTAVRGGRATNMRSGGATQKISRNASSGRWVPASERTIVRGELPPKGESRHFEFVGFDKQAEAKLRSAVEKVTGVDAVIVDPAEFRRLAQTAEDRDALAAYTRTRGEERLPHGLVKRLAAGDSPVRIWREHRGMSLDQLAAAAGKAKGFVSEIETGKKSGSIATLRAIAEALRVDLDDLTV